MEGIFFLLSVIGVGLIMWWVIQNDKVGPTEPTTGLLAMDDTETVSKEEPVPRAGRLPGRASNQPSPVQAKPAEYAGRRRGHPGVGPG